MNINAPALLALLANLYEQLAAVQAENEQLRAKLDEPAS